MLQAIVDIAVPAILVVGMICVGLSIDRTAVLVPLAQPGKIAGITVLQVIFMPAIGIITVVLTAPPPVVALSILLIAACPGGGISNFYVHFARASTTLSVVLSVVSISLASLTLPLALAAFSWLGFETMGGNVPPFSIALRLIAFIVVPVALGFAFRAFAPGMAQKWEERLRLFSVANILLILLIILGLSWPEVVIILPQMLLSAAVFLALALVAGAVAGRLLFSDPNDRFAASTEFVVRNLAIATYVAVGLDGNLVFAGPAALYLLLETVILLPWGQVRRRRLARAP